MPAYGFDGTLTEVQESNKVIRTSQSYNGMRVWSGGEVTPGTGRTVNVAALDGLAAGIYFTTTATTITLDGNTSTATTRSIYYIVAEVNWTANTVTITKVKGTAAAAPVAPSLTQVVGGTWQMPLARVNIAENATGVLAADITTAAPNPARLHVPYVLTPNLDTMSGGATSWNALGTLTILDPGRPYRLQVSATVRFVQTESAGYMRVRAIDPDDPTLVYGEGVTNALNTGRAAAVISARWSAAALSGNKRVRLEMFPQSMSAGEQIQVADYAGNHLTAVPFPA